MACYYLATNKKSSLNLYRMNVNIRNASSSDLAFLVNLEKTVFPVFQQTSKQNIKNGLKSAIQEILIVESTLIPMQPIGALVLFKHKHTLRFYSMALLPEYQNKGIGGFLVDYVIRFAENKGYASIVLEASESNSKLVEWYKSKGFKIKSVLSNYYSQGENAVKMELKLADATRVKDFKNIIVIDQPFKWEHTDLNARIISVKEYLSNAQYQNNSDYRVFNLCSSYKYQSFGYYVSLLASARGQRVIPNITTIRDFKSIHVIKSATFDIDDLINSTLEHTSEQQFSLDIYFGQTPIKKYHNLALKLYQIFEAPLFRINFVKSEKWLIKGIKILSFSNITTNDKPSMYSFAEKYFNKKRFNYPKLANYKYDLAVLVNPKESNPPSNKEALEKLKVAAHKQGVYMEFITKADIDKINEFDALLIRETTNVNHYTYDISRLAYAEGLVVIDDPWSILRCSNKIYQNELFRKNKIKTPNTVSLSKNIFNKKQLNDFNYPIVLKQPDSAFSLGVIKVNDKAEAERELSMLFKNSDMVICQEFLFSDFDWRIGILNNKPLFACKYYMTKNHWQIYNWNSTSGNNVGEHETVAINDVPDQVLNVAQKAASLIGDGLYGVDLKFVDNEVYVVEVNDNPNIDFGVEDTVLKDKLYDELIETIVARIEITKNIRKINLAVN